MTKTFAVASMLLGSSSFALGCAVHGDASVTTPPPPTVVVEGQVGAQAQAGGQVEVVVQGAPPPPPAPVIEVQPPPPAGAEVIWIGGYHRWDGHSYVWVHGRYDHRPHPSAQWRAAHWEPRGAGHVWVEGGWDGQVAVAPPAPPPPVAAPAPPPPQGPTEIIIVEREPPPPPAPIVEVQPPAPSPEHFWVGGYHRWDGHSYVWVHGRYEHRPHPGAQWRTAHWEPRGTKRAWIEGTWDGEATASIGAKDAPPVGPAPGGGAHPEYLHALTDLRNARANLERKGGDKQMKWDEHDAIGAIDRAIHDIKEAALDDGKNLEDHPAVDAHEPRGGRLHKAVAALHAARADVEREEDNAFARGLRGRAAHDIEEAIRFAEAGELAAMK